VAHRITCGTDGFEGRDVTVTRQLYEIPFVVGVTGHRDLPPDQLPVIRGAVESLLKNLLDASPDVRIQLLCSMADGADLLVADVALQLGMDILALLTFPEDICRADLLTEEARATFDRVLARAERLQLPIPEGVAREALASDTAERDRQFQRAALLQARYCSLLVAVWDGKPTTHAAGSARVIEFRRRGLRLAGDSGLSSTDALLSARDNDLIFEIRCTRTSDPAASHAASAVQVRGFIGSDVEPSADGLELPRPLRELLKQTAGFNQDSRASRDQIATRAWPLIPPGNSPSRPALALLNQLFMQSDFLGSFFRRRFLGAIRLRYGLWAAMAALLFSFERVRHDVASLAIILSVLAIFIAGRIHAVLAHRRSWHRKYLDYRALAEALRVDYYWEVAGVRQRYAGEFAHESFLQKQDADLEWIRAAMRSVNLRVALSPGSPTAEGIAETMAGWIGDDTPAGRGGQIHYYRDRSATLSHWLHRAETIDRVLLSIGLLLALTFLVDIVASFSVGHLIPEHPRHYLMWCMALLTLYAGIYEIYLAERADRTLIRQYRYMHGLFGFASRELASASGVEARLEVLRSLGHACLAEHAQWTLAQRHKTIQGLKW
jgi:hypothetical protein